MKILTSVLAFSCFTESRRPNVILLNTDDFGIGDFQIYNSEAKVPTPNIDRLGHEGVRFLSAHSGSSRCSPSRYMLMTGRYAMEDSGHRKIDVGEPHLGEMFQKAGYKTGLFGKSEPLPRSVFNKNATWEDLKEKKRLDIAFKEEMKKHGGNYPKLVPGNHIPGIYEQRIKNQEYNYDYAFLTTFPMGQPGAYYENGYALEPVDTWIRQMPFPEHIPADTQTFNKEFGTCGGVPINGYYGPAGHLPEKYTGDILDLPLFFCFGPHQQLAMKSYDSRHDEEMTVPRLENFIDEHADEEFFAYYGLRSGHGPFNAPERFRNQTEVGNLGEMIMEVDEIVGRILTRLENHGIADDTLVMFMSDNGASSSSKKINQLFGHNQRRLEFPDGTAVTLKDIKNTQGEGGHRAPFLWRLPSRFPPRTIYDPKNPVSMVDIYATLAELIGYDLDCNEAPDSRSLVQYLETGEPTEEIKKKPIMTHSNIRGQNASLRKNNMKYVPGSKELYNLSWDPATENNLYGREDKQALQAHMDEYLSDWLEHLEKREIATKKGRVKDSCYPQFARFNHLNL